MRAICQYEFGDADRLLYQESSAPQPGAGQVRIAVKAAGVHLLDAAIRSGDSGGHPYGNPELPMTPGREVAGVVESLGAGVDGSWLGKRVVAHLGIASGGYAELAVRETEAVHVIPDGVTDEVAVAMIGTGRTALGILDSVPLSPDDVVLVTAAAGGIGALLVQAARNAGATVVGVAGGDTKVERVRRLASGVIAVDYKLPDWPERVAKALAGREVTVVLDGVGGEPGRAAMELLTVAGRLFMFGWSAGEPMRLSAEDLFSRCLSAAVVLGPSLLKRSGGLRSLETDALAQAADGRLTPLTQSFPLSEAAAAHRALESRETFGKVVLIPAS